MPAPFNGSLRSNEIFTSIYNMIISQQVFADNIKGTASKLADMCRVDGGLFGDTKLYYSSDVLKTHPWANDAEAANLLSLDRPEDPFCQKIVIDEFRQIRVTVDNYLSKRAWGTEGAFAQFTSVMLGWLSETKKVYDSTLVNQYICGEITGVGKQTVAVTLPTQTSTDETTDEAYNRLVAEAIAEAVANTLVELTDISREYNDLGYLRSYDEDDLVVVWNSAWVNKLKKVDMPTIFHKEGLLDKFEEVVVPERYFTAPSTSTLAAATYASATYTVTANEEMDVTYVNGAKSRTIHYFPGDVIMKKVRELNGNTDLTVTSYSINNATASTTFAAGDVRKAEAKTTFCKIMHKDSVPFMSAFQTGTNFFNPRSLTDTHYLTYGHNTLQYLYDKPFVTVKEA